MNEKLAVTENKFLGSYDPDKSLKLEVLAEKFHKSGMFPNIKNGMQAFSIVEYGYELGIPPMAALQGIGIVNGKLCPEGKLMLAQFIKIGGKFTVIKRTKIESEIEWDYAGNKGITVFTMADAQLAGLATKDTYRKYPEEMLFWRNTAKGIRRYAPNVMVFGQTIEEATAGEALTVEDLNKSKPLGKDAVITENLTVEPKVIDAEIVPETTPEKEPEPLPDELTQNLKLIQRIHIVRNQKKVSLGQYKAIAEAVTGLPSSKDMAIEQKRDFLAALQDLPDPDPIKSDNEDMKISWKKKEA